MKRIFTLWLAALVATALSATLSVSSGGRYTIACPGQGQGLLVLGSEHGQPPVIWLDPSQSTDAAPDDAWWILAEAKTQDGTQAYTLQNAKTQEYVALNGVRQTGTTPGSSMKGLGLTSQLEQGEGLWLLEEQADGTVLIMSAGGESGTGWNLRTDGTGLLGSYTVTGGANERFVLCDEQGNSISTGSTGGTDQGGTDQGGTDQGGGSQGTDPAPATGDFTAESGQTSDGYYWEHTGLDLPVVATTNTSDPVLYRILNRRSGEWAYYNEAGANGFLEQNAEQATLFYFVAKGNGKNRGYQIFTQDGRYVATNYYSYYQSRYPLQLHVGTTQGDKWGFGYVVDTESGPGYTLSKLTDLPTADADADPYLSQSEKLSWNDYNVQFPGRSIGLWDAEDAGSIWLLLSDDERHLNYLREQGVEFEGGTTVRATIPNLTSSVRILGKELTYDRAAKTYYCSLPTLQRENATLELTAEADLVEGREGYQLTVGGQVPGTEHELQLPASVVETGSEIKLESPDGTVVATAPLRFTFLPIVEVTVPSTNASYYTTGTLRVTNPDVAGYDSTFIAAYKYRGASASNYPKKSYAIKLRDELGESVDREYFGLRNDNNWILDAMAVDHACMRNRVSTDLWMDYSKKAYQRREKWEEKAKTGTRGRFVEMFLDGVYHGLYCMTEKVDRKQLRLKKYVAQTDSTAEEQHGSLYKSTQWSYEVFMGHELDAMYYPMTAPHSYEGYEQREVWREWEAKYPDFETERIDWGPLWRAINLVAAEDDGTFEQEVDKHFDLTAFVDYYLLIELSLATDNHGKNIFLFNYDQQSEKSPDLLGVAVWDLDGTWGRRWDGSSNLCRPDQDFTDFLWKNEHGQHRLFERLLESPNWSWQNMLTQRYCKLRAKEFDTEALVKRFTDYAELFRQSGADTREQQRWPHLHADISADVDYVADWIRQRVEFLDDQYGYVPGEPQPGPDPTPEPEPEPEPDGVQAVGAQPYLSAVGGHGCIRFHCTKPQGYVHVYNVSGQRVRTVALSAALTETSGLLPGVYVVRGQKVVVH